MKAALAVCLLCAIPVWSQRGVPKVQMGSRVAGVTIGFVGQRNGSSTFLIQNGSGHGITAFDVLLVPGGVPKRGNRFLCEGRCSDSSEVDTIDKPAIKAGGTTQVSYDSATLTGGAVIVEAAIFDDGSYGGSERAAAYLIADELGDQGEFDRIVAAVERILASAGPQNVGKSTQIDSALNGLPVDADSATLAAFYRWFPNLRDCDERFPQRMRGVAFQEKANVQARLAQLPPGVDPSDTALTHWWRATEEYMAGFGCSECAAKMASPRPPVKQRMVSVGCSGGATGSGGTAQMADDSGDDDGTGDSTDEMAANDGDSGDGTGQDAGDEQLSMTEEPADAAAPAEAGGSSAPVGEPATTIRSGVSTSVSQPVTTSTRHIPIMPRLIPVGGITRTATSRSGIPAGSEQGTLRPVTDEQLYSRYFRYVVQWEEYLAAGGTLAPDGNGGLSPDPYPAKMKERERTTVAVAAYDYRDALQQSRSVMRQSVIGKSRPQEAIPQQSVTTSEPPLPAFESRRAMPFLALGPPSPETQAMQKRAEERAKLFEPRLEDLRLRLGKTSFRELDEYVHRLYHAIPGRLVQAPLSETAMFVRYLHYIALLDKYAANDSDDGREADRVRADEQKACGLSDKEEGILQQVADDFQQALPQVYGMRTAGTSQPVTTVRAAESNSMGEERKRIGDAHIERLKSGLGEAGLQKVEKRVHMYEFSGPPRVVAAEGAETRSKEGRSAR